MSSALAARADSGSLVAHGSAEQLAGGSTVLNKSPILNRQIPKRTSRQDLARKPVDSRTGPADWQRYRDRHVVNWRRGPQARLPRDRT